MLRELGNISCDLDPKVKGQIIFIPPRKLCLWWVYLYPPQTLFVVGVLFSRCPCVRVCVRPCVRPSVRNVLFF